MIANGEHSADRCVGVATARVRLQRELGHVPARLFEVGQRLARSPARRPMP